MRARYEDHKPFVIFERKALVRFTRASHIAAAAVAALAALLAATTAHAAPAGHLSRHAPGDTITLPFRDALQALIVQDESRAGYERSKFKHWTDADKNGCNTRAEVLLEEAVTAPAVGPNCVLTGGSRYSPYDDQTSTARRSWTSTTSYPSRRPGTAAPPPGRRRNARPTPTTSTTPAT